MRSGPRRGAESLRNRPVTKMGLGFRFLGRATSPEAKPFRVSLCRAGALDGSRLLGLIILAQNLLGY